MTPHPFPDPNTLYPASQADGSAYTGTVFLKAAITHPRMEVADYTYASAFEAPDDWAARLAPYLFDFSPEMLVIGKFCQIADGVTFITASANHRIDGISSYPFAIFDGGRADARPSMPQAGADTSVGNDVWIGQGARILPGTTIGDGVIVGAGATVAGKIPAYSVVVGNPARVVRMRFSAEEVSQLQGIAWWDWPIAQVLQHEAEISGGDVAALAVIASQFPS